MFHQLEVLLTLEELRQCDNVMKIKKTYEIKPGIQTNDILMSVHIFIDHIQKGRTAYFE